MNRWCNKVAVVTGASSGIGASIAQELVKYGMKVIGLDIRADDKQDGNFCIRTCDIAKEEDVIQSFNWVKLNFGGVDVLVNCAGILNRTTMLTEPDNSAILKKILDINVMGLCYCTREAFNSMKDRNVAGHIIHINSLYGHAISTIHNTPPTMNMYPASKYAITALTELLRQELMYLKNKTKVTSISPGVVRTNILSGLMTKEEETAFFNNTPHLMPEDVSQAIVYCMSTPENVQVHELTLRPIYDQF
uniref:Putative dehydrogenase n=1 Tax=Xenopsylla cheopis TaxID=163159 RepID=A0A6M2DFP6_XENCH